MAKRHHASKRKEHHKKQSKLDRYHEHSGEERHLHGYHDPRHLSAHDKEVDRENLMHARASRGYHGRKPGAHHKDPREHSAHHSSSMDAYPDEQYAHAEGARSTDDHMIREDHRAIANLPQEVMIKPYPKDNEFMEDHLDDSIQGVDRQTGRDASQRNKGMSPHKY